MNVRFASILILLLSMSTAAGAEEPPLMNVVSFSTSAQAEVPNDEAVIELVAEHSAASADAVAKAVNEAMGWALERVRGVDAVDAATRAYRTEPRYDRNGQIVSWRASQVLELKSRDIERVTALAGGLQQRLAIRSMQFTTSPGLREKIEAQLTREALERFRTRAELVRESMGAREYDVVSVALGSQQPGPQPLMAARGATMLAAEADIAVEAGRSELVVTAHGQIRLR